jgi:dethiobiotin synthetase
MVADLAATLRLPVFVVTHPALGTLNYTLLTVHAIQSRNLPILGLAMNRVPEESRRDLACQTNLQELTRLTGLPVRASLPEISPDHLKEGVPDAFIDAMMPFAREWWELAQRQ